MPKTPFEVTVCPAYTVIGCAEKQAQEARGVFGCHNFHKCPDCKLVFEGIELWGENGHRQGRVAPDGDLLSYLENRKRRDVGMYFVDGQAMYYKGN